MLEAEHPADAFPEPIGELILRYEASKAARGRADGPGSVAALRQEAARDRLLARLLRLDKAVCYGLRAYRASDATRAGESREVEVIEFTWPATADRMLAEENVATARVGMRDEEGR